MKKVNRQTEMKTNKLSLFCSMKKGRGNALKALFVGIAAAFSVAVPGAFAQSPAPAGIIPTPAFVEKGNGWFVFDENTVFTVENDEQRALAENFATLFSGVADFVPKVQIGGNGGRGNGVVALKTDASLPDEAYEQTIAPGKIVIRASSLRGFFYGLQNLRQLLPPALESGERSRELWRVPAATIKDRPRFGYRGYMLDVSRCFMPKKDLLRLIDCLALLKINVLHLHLTDDNGWRLEIKKYPRLTDVGAWRVSRGDAVFYDRRNQLPGETATEGGFYTQEEMKEIIRFAAERMIEIIPEIDVPAHSNAVLAAYPEFACPTVRKEITVVPGMGDGNSDIIFCAGNEKTYDFLKDVIAEVAALFPSSYLNLGGDEARKTYWKTCPLCQDRIKKEKLKNAEALQGYFMGRLNAYVRAAGKTMMGWDELTNSRLPEDSVILGWQGYGNAALKAAAQGHRFVMAPARIMYLTRYQGPQWFEPRAYFGNNTLKDVFDYEPVQRNWKPEAESLLLGLQTCMWTEFCRKPEDVFYLSFPRTAALAEIAWAEKGKKNWRSFLGSLDRFNLRLEAKGIEYARSMFNIQHKVVPAGEGKLRVELSCIRPDTEIRFTTDNTPPSPASPLYREPFFADGNVVVQAAVFSGKEQKGATLVLPIRWNAATAKKLVRGGGNGREILLNGVRGSLKQTDFEWAGFEPGTFTLTVDLQRKMPVGLCALGCITNYGMGIHKPRSVLIEISSDNKKFVPVGKLEFKDAEIFKEGNYTEDLGLNARGVPARYVRFTVRSPGVNPENHTKPGQESRVYLDEIIVEEAVRK